MDDDDVMLITDGGKVLRCPVGGISSMGRATQGVRVMRLDEGEKLVSIARLAEEDISPDYDDPDGNEDGSEVTGGPVIDTPSATTDNDAAAAAAAIAAVAEAANAEDDAAADDGDGSGTDSSDENDES